MFQALLKWENKFLKKLAEDESQINYKNLFFKIGGSSIVESVIFLEKAGTLYDLLIYLTGSTKRIISSAEIQIKLFRAIDVLIIIIEMKNGFTDKSEEQKKINFCRKRKCFKQCSHIA